MNLERLRWGEWIAGISALDLLLVTFRSWYKLSGGSGHVTAWHALISGRYLLLATVVAGIFLLLVQMAEDTAAPPFPLGWVAAAVGFACTVYVAYRLATPPSDSLDADVGLYLGLASALGVTIGGLLAAREPAAQTGSTPLETEDASAPTEALGSPAEESATWSPAAPAASSTGWSPAAPTASSTGWSPAAPAAPVAPATAAGAGSFDPNRPLRAGDRVALTTGGARFPAGTVAEVVEVFGGGALVEVKAADGMAERFEVPESAFERVPPGGGAAASEPPTPATSPSTAGEAWSPAMPAPADNDWGFDEPAGTAGAGDAEGLPGAAAGGPAPAKVPWWKREIGGGKKKAEEAALVGAAGAAGAGLAAHESETDGPREQRPGFFKRLFGGGGKTDGELATEETAGMAEPEPPVSVDPEPEELPAAGVAGTGPAAESDTAVDEPELQGAPEPPLVAEPEPAAPAAPEAAAESEPDPPAAPDVASEPEAPAAAAEAEPEPEAPIAPAAPEAPIAPVPADAPASDETAAPKPRRRRSSGSNQVPTEAAGVAEASAQPKVGDPVQLKVAGGKYDAGTRGTVVDVFSAGVIVELADTEGRTERLDLPFEAVEPADS